VAARGAPAGGAHDQRVVWGGEDTVAAGGRELRTEDMLRGKAAWREAIDERSPPPLTLPAEVFLPENSSSIEEPCPGARPARAELAKPSKSIFIPRAPAAPATELCCVIPVA